MFPSKKYSKSVSQFLDQMPLSPTKEIYSTVFLIELAITIQLLIEISYWQTAVT